MTTKAKRLSVGDGDVVLLVGTVKGAFLLRARGSRARWDISGPHFPGHSVYAMAYDGRGERRRIWAGASSEHWGAVLRSSDDFGAHWTDPETPNVKFPDGAGASLKQIWQIQPGPDAEPDTLYCGVEPAALFKSDDAGTTWTLMKGLWGHPHRPRWTPGGGGLCLHTIVLDPRDRKRLLIATSTGGVYRSDDAGINWRPANKGIEAYFLPDKYPEFGQCVHKMLRHPVSGRLFLQHHFGVYWSDDAESWTRISKGLPSDFGFPMAAHPRDKDSVYVLPLQSDGFRCPPDGKLRVYRTRGGTGWQALSKGLPQEGCFESVLRDAMATDTLAPAGVYFGTRGGKLYASRDDGRSWSCVASNLPAITCVRAAVVLSKADRGRRKAA